FDTIGQNPRIDPPANENDLFAEARLRRPGLLRSQIRDRVDTTMEWTCSETIGLSLHSCTKCNGLGLTLDRAGNSQACKCALRNIFRICFNQFRRCIEQDPTVSRMTIEPSLPGQTRPKT